MRTDKGRVIKLMASYRTQVVDQPLPLCPIALLDNAAFDQLAGISVLITDDQAEMREVLCAVLTQQGASVDVTSSALEALRAIEQHATSRPFDLAIFDVVMPQEDGLSLVAKLRALEASQGWPRLPTIAFTSFGTSYMRDRALRAGFDRYVVKSVSPIVLYSTISELLDR